MKRPVLLALGLLASNVGCGSGPIEYDVWPIRDDASIGEGDPTSLESTKFMESPADGDPAVVGCADGQREGFADLKRYPEIAGCLGRWVGDMSLRKAPLRRTCGDDTDAKCKSPADVCAPGWHVCGRSGDPRDLSDRINGSQCANGAGPGKFVAAISHVLQKEECSDPPTDGTRYRCFQDGWGAEPVCCGKACKAGKCKDAVWTAQTRISVGQTEGCGSVSSDRNGGILCCKDDGSPRANARPTGAPLRASQGSGG